MKRSVETSKLLQHRAKEVVPDRIRQMRQVSAQCWAKKIGKNNAIKLMCVYAFPNYF